MGVAEFGVSNTTRFKSQEYFSILLSFILGSTILQKIKGTEKIILDSQWLVVQNSFDIGYDGIIRVWETKRKHELCISKNAGHSSNINSLCFDNEATRLYSGDGVGIIKVWSTNTTKNLSFDCIVSFDTLSVYISKFQSSPILNLVMHPGQRKLLVQTGTQISMMDTRIHRMVCTFQQPSNAPAHFNRAALSACGSWAYMASGTKVIGWRSDTGLIVCEYSKDCLKTWEGRGEVVGIVFHPLDHMIAFCRMGERQPVDVYEWNEKTRPLGLKNVSFNSHRI